MRDYKEYTLTQEQREEFDTKYLINNLKLLFSSLFARQQTQIVFGIPGCANNTLLFCNATYDQVEIYESDPELYFHLVIIKDTRFLDLFYTLFPILKECVLLLDSRLFMAGVNKSIKTILDAKLFLSGQELIFECGDISVTCGRLISTFMANRYHEIHKLGIPDIDKSYMAGLSIEEYQNNSAISYVPIYKGNVDDPDVKKSKWMLVQGRTTVSLKEYMKKADPGAASLILRCGGKNTAMRVMAIFNCIWVTVESTNPGMLYYAR